MIMFLLFRCDIAMPLLIMVQFCSDYFVDLIGAHIFVQVVDS